MTFRPSDDVLEEMANGQNSQVGTSQYNTYNNYGGYNGAVGQYGQQNFQYTQNVGNGQQSNTIDAGNSGETPEEVLQALNVPIEEVKAPDLSDLLQNGVDGGVVESANIQTEQDNTHVVPNNFTTQSNNVQSVSNSTQNIQNVNAENSQIVATTNNVDNVPVNTEIQDDLDLVDAGKITDMERTSIVKSIEGSISSNIDFLVDEQRSILVNKYKKLYRILFRWGCLFLCVVVGLCLGVYYQMGVKHTEDSRIIENKVSWKNNGRLEDLDNSGIDLEVEIPYGIVTFNSGFLNSRSNLIKYKGVVLPQLISINYESGDFISMKDFSNKETTRKDIENMVQTLVIDRGNNARNVWNKYDELWEPQKIEGGLINGFSLGCLNNSKFSDVLCDNYLEKFYEEGKFYELSNSQYSSELLSLVRNLRSKKKDIEPICSMVYEYVLKVGRVGNDFDYIMQYCSEDEYRLYKKLINFIDLEKTLLQPELSDTVYDNPDLNAYKLLSAQQTVYKIVGGTTINENFLKSYLNYVQTLLIKDKETGKYLAPIYKDMLYVFNTDQVYQKVLQNGKTDIKLQLDQINNGLYNYAGLTSQLTTPDIINPVSELSGGDIKEVPIEDLFAQYYSMRDRLRIRSVNKISDNELILKTELFTNNIMSITNGKTLKLTVSLRRKGDSLFINNIKIANQPKFTETLNSLIYGDMSLNAMISLIEEKIAMWYEIPSEDEEEEITFCDMLQEREDLVIYTCDDSEISLYKGDVEYNFELVNGVLNTFTIDDENLLSLIEGKLKNLIYIKDNTPTIITSIIDFSLETKDDDGLESKIEIIDQFRIHFKLVPDDIRSIEGTQNEFMVDLTLGKIKLQARYNIETHMLTNISYVACEKTLEIRNFELQINSESEPQLAEILNNPQVYLATLNAAAYKKYQRLCDTD